MKKVLKVIDNVNLDKLIDYGFRKYEEEYRYDSRRSLKIRVKKKDKILRLTSINAEDSVILYKLIKDDLIEQTEIKDTRYDRTKLITKERDAYKKALEDVEQGLECFALGWCDNATTLSIIKNILKIIRNAFEETE